MERRRVALMDCDEGLPKGLKQEHAELVKRNSELERGRCLVDEIGMVLTEGELTPAALGKLNDVRAKKLLLWQSEIKLRQDYENWLRASLQAFSGLRQKAEKDKGKTENDIRQRLVGIGFLDGPGTELHPSRVKPGMWLDHPAYRSLSDRERVIDGVEGTVRTAIENNAKAREATLGEVNAFRQKMVSALA